MNYELIENITSADIAVRVKASSLSLLFKSGAEALMSEMIEDINSINNSVSKNGTLEGSDLSILYFEFLNEFLFFKDAENLLLLPEEITITPSNSLYICSYKLTGEKINRDVHRFRVDIKAVTLHALDLYEENGIFIAESVFDV
jgi:SHS2 domain-containing protein